MLKRYKRILSSIIAAVMTVGVVTNSFTVTAMAADARKVDVWDFGGVQQTGTMYQNHITPEILDALECVGDSASGSKGKFLVAGSYSFGGDCSITANANDRLYYTGGQEARNYGTLSSHALTTYPDGYTAGGEYYANGTGGSARRFVQIDNCKAGDVISAYVNNSNAYDGVAVLSNINDTSVPDVRADYYSGGTRCDMIVAADGSYKVWIDSSGKPIFNRVVRYPAVTVSGSIDLGSTSISGYGLKFSNKATNGETTATLNADGTFTAALSPGYDYTAVLTGAVGYGFTNGTKTVSVSTSDCETGTKANVKLAVEEKKTYKASGAIVGMNPTYNKFYDIKLTLVPPEESLADPVEVPLTINGKLEVTFSDVMLEPDIEYTAVLGNANDFEIISGEKFCGTVDINQDINVAEKPRYNVTGEFVGLPSNVSIQRLEFVNMEDEYSYNAYDSEIDGEFIVGLISGNKYSIDLRDGSYRVVSTDENYITNTHILVNGGKVTKNLLFVNKNATIPSVDWKADVYVGDKTKSPNYATINEALTAIKGMGVDSEAKRVTVHIAPGTYREQIIVDTPYVTFKNDTDDDVILTWYYGIGYQYYSSDSTGYYNYQNVFDRFDKHPVSKWGCATYVKEAATAFRADGITFEASFNKYVTDEEIEDGVELSKTSDSTISTVRRASTDVTKKSATERSSALAIESDNSEFYNCKFIGSQDTLYTGSKDYNQYYKNCTIEGNTDYIFGDGNCVFDGCELKWCGYSDTATAGYITAAKDVASLGYLFRGCTVTPKDGMKVTAGYFGRPWGANAKVTFQDTKLAGDMIAAAGWTAMSGNTPDKAGYKEYNTTYAGQAVDTSARTNPALTEKPVTDVKTYFGDWTPVFYTEESGTPAFVENPSLSSSGDINIPYTGEKITVYYVLNDKENDASQISWYLVSADGTETLVAADTASYTPDASAEGCFVKVVVTPAYISGAKGEAKSFTTEAALKLGSGGGESGDVTRVGDTAVFLVGDSTVKDYSAGAINNSGAARVEGSWGEFFQEFFNEKQVQVYDYAEGGRSSRTFINNFAINGKNDWIADIESKLQPGDYMFIQFGHNDCSETYADRYVPLGTPDANGIYPITEPTDGKNGMTVEGSGSFKYYLNQYIEIARKHDAIPVLVTPVARMYFNSDGTIKPHHCTTGGTENTYCIAMEQLGAEKNVQVIDLYTYSAGLYEQAYKDDTAASAGTSSVASRLFAFGEKTHHSKMGGFILAAQMAKFVQDMNIAISDKVIAPTSVDGLDQNDENEFTVTRAGVFTAYDKNDPTLSSGYKYSIVDEYWTNMGNKMIEALTGTVVEPEYKYGDTDSDNQITASDAANILQKAIDASYASPAEAAGIDAKLFMDVDMDGTISASDAAMVLQKALDAGYVLPIEASAN